ncbi:EexN family lipoprotein [Vogesella fluminis]
MKKIIPFLLVAAVTACGQSETPQKANPSEANIPTVEELAANPERLKELRQQCKTDRPNMGDVLCNRVAEATRKRFYGDGETPTRRRRNRPSSDCWRLAASPSFSRHAAMRYRLRRFSLIRRRTHSVFLLDFSAENGL